MPYIAPGVAALQGLMDTIAQQRAQARQAFLDSITAAREQREAQAAEYEHQDRQLAAQQRAQTAKDALEDRQRQNEARIVDEFVGPKGRFRGGDFVPADVSPDMVEILKRHGAVTEDQPGAGIMQDLATGTRPGALRFAKTTAQRDQEDLRQAQRDYVNSLPPGSPERQAAEFQLGTGHPMPAGALTPTPSTVPVFYYDGRTGRLLDSRHQPFEGDLPANAKVLNRQYAPAVSAGGAAGVDSESQLAADIVKNPSLWKGLNPTRKTNGLIHRLTELGFDFNLAQPTPSMSAGIQRLSKSLGALEGLDQQMTQQNGLAGKAEGMLQTGAAMLGTDANAALYRGISSSLLPALARASGEVGNLAEKEQQRYEQLAPKVSDPANIRRAKYAAIHYMIDAADKGAKAQELAPFLDYMQFASEGGSGTPPASPDGAMTVGGFTVRVKPAGK